MIHPIVLSAMKRVKKGEKEGRESIGSRDAVLCGEDQESVVSKVVFEKTMDPNMRQ